MSETDSKFLEIFPSWLSSLGEDAENLSALVGDEGVSNATRETVTGGLNYLFKSLDLIPDVVDDIGYLDDAFVLRVAADIAVQGDEASDAAMAILGPLAKDCDEIRDFLGDTFPRLSLYVKGLHKGAARGRSVTDILAEATIREQFVQDVKAFTRTYEAPAFTREEKTLIRMRAFFDAKLPR